MIMLNDIKFNALINISDMRQFEVGANQQP